MQENAKLHITQRRAYDLELAFFLKQNYDSLSQKRWKYILEYNQTKYTFHKAKQEKEVRRLLRLIRA